MKQWFLLHFSAGPTRSEKVPKSPAHDKVKSFDFTHKIHLAQNETRSHHLCDDIYAPWERLVDDPRFIAQQDRMQADRNQQAERIRRMLAQHDVDLSFVLPDGMSREEADDRLRALRNELTNHEDMLTNVNHLITRLGLGSL